MQLDSEDLLAQIRHDWPDAYETSVLRLQVRQLAQDNDRLVAENERLNASQTSVFTQPPTGTYSNAGTRPYVGTGLPVDDEGVRHAG